MSPIARRFLSMAAVLVTALAVSSHAEAGLVVTLAPAGGSSPTDLSNVHVGDTLYFVSRGGSDAPADTSEYLLSLPDIHLFNRLTFTVFDVPEPSSIALAMAGLLALGLGRRKA